MPRGSLPGERRGGRKPGTPNKATVLKNAVFLAAAAEPNRSPLEFMLALMRDPQVPLDTRIEMAGQAAPFVHARPEPVRKKRPDPLDSGNLLGGPGDTGDLKFDILETKSSAGEGRGLTPMDFLLIVMADPAAAPRQRIKAAVIAARYKHPYAGGGRRRASSWRRISSASKLTWNCPVRNAMTACASASSRSLKSDLQRA